MRKAVAAAGLAVTLTVAACTSASQNGGPSTADSGDGSPSQPTSPASPPTPGPTESAPATTPPKATPATADPASIQALIDAKYDGAGLKLGAERGSTNAYRQYYATYRGDGLTISGRINIPRGRGPFPAVVLAHGHVDLDEYTNGATMLRERDYLARQGYITLHIDYRNHAQSSRDPDNDTNLRAGYTKDAINAALALKAYPAVDPNRLAIIGRSMGGGVVYNAVVARPGLFKAAVAYSPVSSLTGENFNHFVRRNAERSASTQAVIARLGTPEASPATWAAMSPRTYFGRVTDPIMIHHGTADESCPIAWSQATTTALKAAGKQVTYHVYQAQRHTFTSLWPLSIRRTTAFLDAHLR